MRVCFWCAALVTTLLSASSVPTAVLIGHSFTARKRTSLGVACNEGMSLASDVRGSTLPVDHVMRVCLWCANYERVRCVEVVCGAVVGWLQCVSCVEGECFLWAWRRVLLTRCRICYTTIGGALDWKGGTRFSIVSRLLGLTWPALK